MSEEAVENPDYLYNEYLGGVQDTDDRESFGLQVGELLYGINMHMYIPLFREKNIGIDLFLYLNEDDLSVLGVEEKDIPAIAKLIQCVRPKTTIPENINTAHLQDPAEPQMSMKNVLLMQCHTAKHLRLIRKMVEIIESKLKKNEYNNTLIDTDYCAARALKIVCTELVRQAYILSSESKHLNEALQRIGDQGITKKKTFHNGCILAGVVVATIAPMAVILWRFLRK